MTERKQIMKMTVITDDDCGMYQLGEIDGGFCHDELKEYLIRYKEYGFQQLLTQLAYIQRQVLDVMQEINTENSPKACNGRMT